MSQIRRIIRKYFSHTHYPTEVYHSFVKWFKGGHSAKEKDDAFREIWNELVVPPDQSTEASFVKLRQRIEQNSGSTCRTKRTIPLFRRNVLRVASVVLVPVLSFGLGYMYVKNCNPEVHTADLVEYFVPNGEIREITLPDLSKVQLNSGSLLIYPTTFSGKTRDLYLNGEALFSVTPDEKHPFIVKTADMDIEVLGTIFNVSSYHTDNRISTTLESGRVNVRMKNESAASFVLEPNEQIVLDRATGETKVEKVDVQRVTAWQKGYVMAERMILSDIAKLLERKYNIRIHINSGKYENQYITVKFRNNESLTESFSVLQQLIPGMKYRIEGNDVYIY